jgi:hypothetical protein
MARLFDPALAPLGLHLSRAHLEAQNNYQVDAHGTHLALYVQPTASYTSTQYRRNFNRVAAIFLPTVFRRWSGLTTFDVCQEPLASVDPRPEAPPVTQLFVSRRFATRLRWGHASLPQVMAATRHVSRQDLSVFVDDGVLKEPAYQG